MNELIEALHQQALQELRVKHANEERGYKDELKELTESNFDL